MHTQTSIETLKEAYKQLRIGITKYRKLVNRPLTLSEKIMAGHMISIPEKVPKGGKDYVFLRPDRVALQDVTGQMVMLQFMQAGLDQVMVPTTVHCDHLIRAKINGDVDMNTSLGENNEVFRFLQSAAARYGCGFWRPGAGIIHQVVLENYAFPGGLMIGTDSHTPNAGGLGMIAVGVGGLDATEVMAGSPWEILYPKRIGIKLTGTLQGWAAPKDVILKVASELTVSGGTNSIIEYFGSGTESISCTGKATITNMGAEVGATCSIFPYDKKMEVYLMHTDRSDVMRLAKENKDLLVADPGSEEYFDRIIQIDMSSLEPHIVGPHTPDLARSISKLATDVEIEKYTDHISVALIGSCTNSSYEDMSRAASLADQARAKGVIAKTPLLVTPGSEQIRATIERDGQMGSLRDIGATVLANACGPCIGQWSRPEIAQSKKEKVDNPKNNTIVTTFNRNFPGRNDGHRSTLNFIGSPEMIIALALGGRLSFNPITDELDAADGTKFKLKPPPVAPEVPQQGFQRPKGIFVAPPSSLEESLATQVIIDSNSGRLQRLEPFPEWDRRDLEDMPIMVKAKGKCTTDHISPAGAWLSLRGHLENLSDNMLLGAVSAFGDDDRVGVGKNSITGKLENYATIAREYKTKKIRWVIIGDENYGEGSSREHAAMTPRYLGCAVVIAKSLARIHETNLKKQGVLALTFADPADYEKILEDDRLSIHELGKLEPGKPVRCTIIHTSKVDSSNNKDSNQQQQQQQQQQQVSPTTITEEILLNHSYSDLQIGWFRAGSALNILKKNKK